MLMNDDKIPAGGLWQGVIVEPYFSSDRIGDSLVPTVKTVMTRPREFFERMPVAESYGNSLILLSIYLAIPALIVSIFSGVITLIVILPLSLLFGVIGTWMWAWYLSWAARVFCKVPLSIPDAFQLCAYSAAPMLFSWIPLIGSVSFFWNLFLNWQGMVSHAKVGGGAALMIILGAFIMMSLSIVALAAALWLLASQYGIDMHISDMQQQWQYF
jgi:hypothetical protein